MAMVAGQVSGGNGEVLMGMAVEHHIPRRPRSEIGQRVDHLWAEDFCECSFRIHCLVF